MNPVQLVPFSDAVARYALDDVLSVSDPDEHGVDAVVAVFDQPARLDALPLDFFELDAWAGLPTGDGRDAVVVGVVAAAGLTVTGAVINGEGDFGPFLHVVGDLVARDVFTAGSEVTVTGAVTVERSLVGFYNHGLTEIGGSVGAEVVLTLEHSLTILGAVTAELVVGGNFLAVGTLDGSQVGGWVGRVCGRDGKPLDGLGADRAPLRLLDPGLFDWDDPEPGEPDVDFVWLDAHKVLAAIEAGRSLLRGDRSWGPPAAG